MSEETTARRFQISDSLVLVVAAALMISANRLVSWLWASHYANGGVLIYFDPHENKRAACSMALIELSLCLLCSVLLRPKDRTRLRYGAPGLLVHLVIWAAVAVRVAERVAHAALFTLFGERLRFYGAGWRLSVLNVLNLEFPRDATMAILAGWLALAVVGKWKPERAWDDRLGRLLGIAWVIFYLGGDLFVLLS
jgi:hypothetical protein